MRQHFSKDTFFKKILDAGSWILDKNLYKHCILHPVSCILCPVFFILNPAPCTLLPPPYLLKFFSRDEIISKKT